MMLLFHSFRLVCSFRQMGPGREVAELNEVPHLARERRLEQLRRAQP